MLGIDLHYLDTRPAAPCGVTWGVSWPRGELAKGEAARLCRADGTPLPLQSWPLAYWPDGSVKWLGCAAVLGPEDGATFALAKGAGPAPETPLSVRKQGIEVIRIVDTGPMRVEVGDRGRYLIQEIVRDGPEGGERSCAGGIELACLLEERRNERKREIREREGYAGIVEQLTVEQSGPLRAAIKLVGRYRGEVSGRLWLPFSVRLVFYAGCDTVDLVHSFTYTGKPDLEFIAGLGVKAHVLLHQGVHNRHVRVVGEGGEGTWVEPVRWLPLEGHSMGPQHRAQVAGEPVPAPARGGQLPAWNDVQLLQDACDHAVLRKRQDAAFKWVAAEHCRRAPGVISLSEPEGGLALGLRDFWQAYPTCVETSSAGTTEAHLNGWWWAPDAEAMDLRHYGGRDHRPIYEARNPDPAVYSSAYGIARTSQLTLWAMPAGTTPGDLRARSEGMICPPLLVCDPAHYHACRVFGPNWRPVDRSTPARAEIEDRLSRAMDYYTAQQERWRWYGFWNYGDVMHTYDVQRHAWHYDQGGRAWDNTELGADIWPWYNFLRSGRARWFRFAEAMTRHVSEVDVFHLGPWTAQGSRHNVVHWGGPCKEPRASQAGAKRFYHYFTADERCRDLLDEVAEQADQFKATNVPTQKAMARVGPTWAAWSANWMCAWERTGDARWRDKIVKGLEGILAAPHKLMQGDPFDYDPASGEMRYSQAWPFPTNRLVLTMGGAEAWMELAELLDHDAFSAALAEFGAAYAVHPRDAASVPAERWQRTGLIWGYARLLAWAGRALGEPQYGRRAWEILLQGAEDAREQGTQPWPDALRDAPPALSAEPWQDWGLATNTAAMGSLNLIACLALAGEALETVWRELRG